jgi:flavin-dependent dehydrogenase
VKLYDALVIGAGPAGTTSALMLARAGWSVAIAEKTAFPRRKVCGEFISATSLPLLEELGLGDEFRARAGPPVREVGLYAGDTELRAAMPRLHGGAHACGRALGREHLDTLMLRAAVSAGAHLWQPWTVKTLARGAGNTHLATLQDGHACTDIHARLVIAAHGSWEHGALPTHVPRQQPRASDLFAFKAHYLDCGLSAGLMPLLVFPGGYGGMVRADGGRATLSCCIRRDTLAHCRAARPGLTAAESVIAHIRSTCSGVDAALSGATLDQRWLAAGPIRPGIRTVRTDSIFAVGNAAGEAHPLVAEGISMAIQSAYLLCGKLIADTSRFSCDRALADFARAYGGEWRRSFARRVHAAAFFAHIATRPVTAQLATALLARVPSLLTCGAYVAGKSQLPVPTPS